MVKFLVAVGGDFGLFAHHLYGTNAVQHTIARWPELYLIYDIKEFNPFTVKPLFHLLSLLSFQDHCSNRSIIKKLAESPGVAPGCMDLESM